MELRQVSSIKLLARRGLRSKLLPGQIHQQGRAHLPFAATTTAADTLPIFPSPDEAQIDIFNKDKVVSVCTSSNRSVDPIRCTFTAKLRPLPVARSERSSN